MKTGDVGSIAGGYDTTHISAAEADRIAREERQDAALRFLLRKDLRDVAEMLGLVPVLCEAGCGAPAHRGAWCADPECRKARREAAIGARLAEAKGGPQ